MSKLNVIVADTLEKLDELFKEYEVEYDWQPSVWDAFMEGEFNFVPEKLNYEYSNRDEEDNEKLDKLELARNKFSDIVSVVKEIKLVDSFGGEGMGDQYWSVYQFISHQGEVAYVKFYGWYQSYNGSEYTDYKFVTPQEKTVVVYE